MTTITITQFKGYTEEMFLQYLQCYGSGFISIIIPKDFGDEAPGLIMHDYLRALYTGQLLGRISEDVFHSVPDPSTPGEFSFIIATTKWTELAKLLVYLYNGFDDDDHFEDCFAFDQESFNFIDKMEDDEEFTCPYFFEVIEDYC